MMTVFLVFLVVLLRLLIAVGIPILLVCALLQYLGAC
jgi:hypothetical protein